MDHISIRDVATAFDLPISTLHYWERRGLITPYRRSGWRCYEPEQLYRIALIKLWRTTGQLGLDDIAAILAGRTASRDWRDIVTARMDALEAQSRTLATAREYLEHLLTCPRDNALEQCPGFRATVDLPGATPPATVI